MKILLSIITCTLLSVVCKAQDFDYSFKESYPTSLPGTLIVSSSDGNIEVMASTGNKIEVFYIVKKNNRWIKIDRKELEKEVTLTVTHANNVLEVSVKNDYWEILPKDQVDVHFKIFAPQQISAQLHTSDGNISLSGLSGDQQCKTSDGNINIAGITGAVSAKTSDGNIRIKNIEGAVSSKTSDGDISIEMAKGNAELKTSDGNIDFVSINGDVSAKTSDGNIFFRAMSGSLHATTSDGNIKGDVVKPGRQLIIKTSDGNITIALPGHLGLDLNIKGESLQVPLKNFSGHADDEVITGKVNGGGIPVNLFSDGKVVVSFRKE